MLRYYRFDCCQYPVLFLSYFPQCQTSHSFHLSSIPHEHRNSSCHSAGCIFLQSRLHTALFRQFRRALQRHKYHTLVPASFAHTRFAFLFELLRGLQQPQPVLLCCSHAAPLHVHRSLSTPPFRSFHESLCFL